MMKLTHVKGTVTGMFVYHPQGEIDIEMVSALQPPEAYFAVHPGITTDGRASSLTHGEWVFDFSPSAVCVLFFFLKKSNVVVLTTLLNIGLP